MLVRKFLTNFLVCLSVFYIHAQDTLPPKLKFFSLTDREGLPNNIVNSIAQDSLGFMWIGTNDGLGRYDGNSFRVYREGSGSKYRISNNYIQSVYVDPAGVLWVLTDQGLNRYNNKTEHFVQFTANGQEGSISNNSVTAISGTSEGVHYLGSYGGGIDVLEDGVRVRTYTTFSGEGLNSDFISALALKGDKLWVGTYDNGLELIDLNTERVRSVDLDDGSGTVPTVINDLYLDAKGILWIGADQGLFVLDTETGTKFVLNKENTSTFSDSDILSVSEDQDGTLWVGTRNSGMLFAQRNTILEAMHHTEFGSFKPSSDNESINHRSVSTFFQDTGGYLWIGTHLGGVNVVDPRGEVIQFHSNFYEEGSLGSKSVWGITEDNRGNLWIGTDGGGVSKFDPYTREFDRFTYDADDPDSPGDNAILTALCDSNGDLWFGTYSGGISRLDKNTGRFRRYQANSGNTALNANDVRVLFEDSRQRIWVGSNGGGLQRYHSLSDDFEFIPSVGWLDIRAITEDPDGNLWIGTYGNGIVKYEPDTGQAFDIPSFDAVNAHIVFSIKATSSRDLWIGTRFKGLYHLDLQTWEVTNYGEAEGLSNGTIHAIVPEKSGDQMDVERLWLSTNEGLARFDVQSETFTEYSDAFGVQAGPFNNNSGFRSANGYMAFGGINGLNLFYPGQLLHKTKPNNLVFTRLQLFNETVDVAEQDKPSPLQQSISVTREITLKHDQNLVTIHYAALQYPVASDVRYAYQLENYDEQWNHVGNITSATYRNLAPGTYVFKVKADDTAQPSKGEILQLKINVLSPWWYTWPAIVFYILTGVFALYFILRYYTGQIKLRHSLIVEKQLREQEAAINRERFRFFTNFSHELRTPLTLILGPVEDMLEEHKGGVHQGKLDLVYRNSRILKELIDKLLEFRKSESDRTQLELSHLSMRDFIQIVVNNFEAFARRKKVELVYEYQGAGEAYFDDRKFQIILNNLLSNAFKYTPEGGQVSVKLSEDSTAVYIKISDTGIGIDPDSLTSVFNLYFHKDDLAKTPGTGIGLALCKKLVDLHQGEIFVNSTLGQGTSFHIKLLKGTDHFEESERLTFKNTTHLQVKLPVLVERNLPLAGSDQKDNEFIDARGKVILIVDDNPDILSYLREILKDEFSLVTARNGKEGIEKAIEVIPDAVISDVMMPEKTGFDLCKALKEDEKTSHIPILLLTARHDAKDELEGMQLGADAYIRKPFDARILRLTLNNLFKTRARFADFIHLNRTREGGTADSDTQISSLDQRFYEKLKDHIISGYMRSGYGLDDLAADMGYSRSSLYRKVKGISGESLNIFVRKVRMHHALELLRSESLNVTEVSQMVGYNDVDYFRSCFKKEFGSLPSEAQQGEVKKEMSEDL